MAAKIIGHAVTATRMACCVIVPLVDSAGTPFSDAVSIASARVWSTQEKDQQLYGNVPRNSRGKSIMIDHMTTWAMLEGRYKDVLLSREV